MENVVEQQIRNKQFERQQSPDQFLHEIGNSVFVVDPRFQGFGLREHRFLDAYANKFFILSGSGATFISPQEIPDSVQDYYEALDIDVASRDRVVALEDADDEHELVDRVRSSPRARGLIEESRGKTIIPYMYTQRVEEFAEEVDLKSLSDAETTTHVADKARFREALDEIAADIQHEIGIDIRIPTVLVQAKERRSLEKAYSLLSKNGEKKVVVTKPQSASALGVFVIPEGQTSRVFHDFIDKHFLPEEEVMVNEYIEHSEAPSMQGGRLEDNAYGHFYFGRQLLQEVEGRISYEGSQVPFGHKTSSDISQRDLQRMREVHKVLGEHFMTGNDIVGVAGFDTLLHFSPDGDVETLKVTEANLHLPSSLAVFAAIRKLFPDGFEGVSHNFNMHLPQGVNADDFMRRNRSLLLKQKNAYGMFPLNVSYDDKVDIVLFGRDLEHIGQLRKGIVTV